MTTSESFRPIFFTKRIDSHNESIRIANWNALFHTRAAATGKARSLTVDSRDGGTTRAGVNAERRRRRNDFRRHAGSRWRGTVAQCHRDSGKREQRHIKMLNVAYGQSFSNKCGCSQMLETEVFKTTS